MIGPLVQANEIDTFKMANNLLKNPVSNGKSFDEVLETQVKEAVKQESQKVCEDSEENKEAKNSKKKKEHQLSEDLINVTQIIQNTNTKNSREIRNTYLLLEKFRENKKYFEEDFSKGQRYQQLNAVQNYAGQPSLQQINDQTPKRMTKSQMLAAWEKYSPLLTEDITKRAIRIDIPLINDIQVLILRMHSDRSLTASLLGSQAMAELIKQNKDQLDRNLRHHRLSLREFNTYRTEIELNNESGTRKKKKQAAKPAKKVLDIF